MSLYVTRQEVFINLDEKKINYIHLQDKQVHCTFLEKSVKRGKYRNQISVKIF